MQKIKNIYHWIRSWFWVVWYGYPARNLTVIGVTGTDGKTTTTTLIYEILKAAGLKVEYMTTVNSDGLHVTNPDAQTLQKWLRKQVDLGMTHVVLEVTSHGLDQNRVVGCNFMIGVLTNITHEHLDYHGSMEAYGRAKAKLLVKTKYAVLNRDDESYAWLEKRCRGIVTGYEKTKYKEISQNLEGEYNKYNIGAAQEVAKILKIQESIIKKVVKDFEGVPGRREEIKSNHGFRVIVDFAHTPNALQSLLEQLKKEKKGKLIVVFGCTGERDKTKRPMMGQIAKKLADVVIVTSDDTRSEKQEDIYRQIGVGIREDDREKAIKMAVEMARPGDIVALCGKGHEKSINLGGVEYPWSDVEVAKRILAEI